MMKVLSNFKIFFSRKKIQKYYNRFVVFIIARLHLASCNLKQVIKRRPVASLAGTLLLLFLIIVLGTIISAPKKAQPAKPPVKSVQVYKIGVAPRITVQAKIEKSGVVKITALTGGVVSFINVSEGDDVGQGANLVTLASNYAGGNALAIQAQIVQTQYKNVLDTYQQQKDLIQKQKDLTNSSETNAANLRDISSKSIDETQNLINLDQDILNTLGQNLSNFEASNSAGINNTAILQTQQLKSQFQAAVNGLNQALRSSQYQASNTNPPADIAREQKDITLKQLDIQDKAIDLNKEISRLQAILTQVNAAIMHPTAPFAGRVERVYVREGMSVNPGTPLLLLAGNKGDVNAVAVVSQNIANNVSQTENSTLYFGNHSFDEHPFFISDEATDNGLYTIQFSVPEGFSKQIADGDYISVSIPIGYPNTGQTIPYIPLDAIYQSQDKAYLFVIEDGKAVSKNLVLGQIYGRFVEIKSGLQAGDQVILNRNIIAGDPVLLNY